MSKKNDKIEKTEKTEKTEKSETAVAEKKSQPEKIKNRRVLLFGRLENDVVQPVIQRILKLNDRDPKKEIDLYINSSGGNGYNADAIIAVMNGIEAAVNTICLGHALSGACEVLASGTGTRSSYEFATLMFHQTLWEADGDITNLEIQAKQGQKFREAQIELLSRCTRQEKARIRADIERDFYLSSQEALKYGLIDEIIKHTGSGKRKAAGAKSAAAELKTSPKVSKVASARQRK